jgi:hypothetical protein
VRIFLRGLDEDTYGNAKIKKDGSFETDEMTEGGYVLRVFGMDHKLYIKSAKLGADDVLEKGVQIGKSMPSTSLEIVVATAVAQLDGVVTMDNKPLAGATVHATGQPETPYTEDLSQEATTDQHGSFSVPEIPPGKYQIRAYSASEEEDEEDGPASEPQVVTLGEKEHKSLQLEIKAPSQ